MSHTVINDFQPTEIAAWAFTLFILRLQAYTGCMKKAFLFLQTAVVAMTGVCSIAQTGSAYELQRSTQLIVVTTPGWDTVQGTLQRYERVTTLQHWRPLGEPIRIVVGKNGLGWGIGVATKDTNSMRIASEPVKKEGDGKSPAGIFSLGTSFGYAPQPPTGARLHYLSLTPSIECVDDAESKYYNQLVDRSATTVDWKSSEHMRDSGEAYRWGIVVEHNMRANRAIVPSGGSCVFLHIWHDAAHGTAGCTAMEQPELEMLLRWLDPAAHPLLIQLPASKFEGFKHTYLYFAP